MHLLWFKTATEERIGYWAAHGNRFLVSQTYHNAYHFYPKHQRIVVLSAYPTHILADEHFRKVQVDPFAAMINLNHAHHRQALQKRFASTGHQLFIAEINDPVQLQLLCYNYKQKLLAWLAAQIGETIITEQCWPPDLLVKFGLVYIRFKWKKQEHIIVYDQLSAWYEEKSLNDL